MSYSENDRKPEAMMRWHYTVGMYIPPILSDGFIKPATALVVRPEKPITWFTSSVDWEETANKGLVDHDGNLRGLSREETVQHCGGIFRIGVADDYPLRRFVRITRESKQDPALTRALIETARMFGSNPYDDWWGTFNKVKRVHWKAIERFTPNGWQLANPDEIAAVLANQVPLKLITTDFDEYERVPNGRRQGP